MIYISTALHAEALPVIQHYGLKRVHRPGPFELYQGDGMKLIVSGIGILPGAIAVSSLLTAEAAGMNDVYANIGSSGAAADRFSIGDAVLCHKIIHHDTRRSGYPDILIRHGFQEGVLETFSHPVGARHLPEIQGELVDMEGAGIFEAASRFLAPHQMIIVKVISDSVQEQGAWQEKIDPELTAEHMRKHLPTFDQLLEDTHAIVNQSTDILKDSDLQHIQQTAECLRLTATMTYQLEQWVKQYKIRTGEESLPLQGIPLNPVKTKREGKMRFEELRAQFLHE